MIDQLLTSKRKLRKLRCDHFEIGTDIRSEINNEDNGYYIYINECLTEINGKLVKEAGQKANAKNYPFKGYTTNGQVMLRKNTNSNDIIIDSMEELGKIV